MKAMLVEGTQVALDPEGYLIDLAQWSPDIAQVLAEKCGLPLKAAHWELIQLMRSYYEEFDHSPAMRPFIKYIRINLDESKAKSIYLMQLFPGDGSPVKRIAQIAGLPKPDNCL